MSYVYLGRYSRNISSSSLVRTLVELFEAVQSLFNVYYWNRLHYTVQLKLVHGTRFWVSEQGSSGNSTIKCLGARCFFNRRFFPTSFLTHWQKNYRKQSKRGRTRVILLSTWIWLQYDTNIATSRLFLIQLFVIWQLSLTFFSLI